MRKILHSDLNNFYASVECLLNPDIRDFPVVVCGRVEDRHGIVLAKNMIAKKAGIKTGMVLYEARGLCPNLKCVEAHHDIYAKYSKAVKDIYREYTDRVESFGIDEAWIDITNCHKHGGDAYKIADEIRNRVKTEIGLTVSIGISFNKVFAKLGSDLKKPDAITEISVENYKDLVWPLPVEDLLFVGRKTKKKLNSMNVKTIGDLAKFSKQRLMFKFGKVGAMLHEYANGQDSEIVHTKEELDDIKSVGNSLTFYRDITTDQDVKALLILLSESVCKRMLSYGYKYANTVCLVIMTSELSHIIRTKKINATNLAEDFANEAYKLFKKYFKWGMGYVVRGLGVSVCGFVNQKQMCFDDLNEKADKKKNLQDAVENLRNRFGRNIINRAIIYTDKRMKNLNIVADHTENIGRQLKQSENSESAF